MTRLTAARAALAGSTSVLLALGLAACTAAEPDPTTTGSDTSTSRTSSQGGGGGATSSTDGQQASPDTGSDGAGTATAGEMTLDPCLLEASDIDRILRGSYADGVLDSASSEWPTYVCNYAAVSQGETAVSVTVTEPGGPGLEKQRPTYEPYQDVTDIKVPGAAAAFSANGGAIVLAQVGDYTISVQDFEKWGNDPDGTTAELAALAVKSAGAAG